VFAYGWLPVVLAARASASSMSLGESVLSTVIIQHPWAQWLFLRPAMPAGLRRASRGVLMDFVS
jgi:hypothetical protein